MDPEQNKTRAANIRTIWEALLTPKWDRDLLISFGKLLYARRPLKEVDDTLFADLLPRLIEIVEVLEAKFKAATPPTITEGSPRVSGVERSPGATGAAEPAGLKGPSEKPSRTPAILHAKEKPDEPKNAENLLADVASTRKE